MTDTTVRRHMSQAFKAQDRRLATMRGQLARAVAGLIESATDNGEEPLTQEQVDAIQFIMRGAIAPTFGKFRGDPYCALFTEAMIAGAEGVLGAYEIAQEMTGTPAEARARAIKMAGE